MSQLKKLEREQSFNTDEFNKKFEEIDIKNPEFITQKNPEFITQKNPEFITQKEPEFITQKEPTDISYTEDIGINIKNLFFEILEILMNKKNPIPYIIENEKRQFLFAIMILIIGGLLLFWSNLMINDK
jgi:hypothetical protein